MGLPEVNIVFRSLAVSAIERSERGIVALVVKDSTATKNSYQKILQMIYMIILN